MRFYTLVPSKQARCTVYKCYYSATVVPVIRKANIMFSNRHVTMESLIRRPEMDSPHTLCMSSMNRFQTMILYPVLISDFTV